jgi:hypothetical protein
MTKSQTLEDTELPEVSEKARYTPLFKARVVNSIKTHSDFEKAKQKYLMSEEELLSWFGHFKFGGIKALKATNVQKLELSYDKAAS